MGEDMFDQSNELLEVDESAQVSYKATSCKSGIERFTNGTSNAMQSYTGAMAATTSWVDPEFGADSSSLNWQNAGYSTIGGGTPPTSLAWKRVSELDANPKLFGSLNHPNPQGVRQGGLGDCWFLAAASSISEDPNRVYRFMQDRVTNPKGIYRFYFWIKNGWYGINIDDRLPVRSWGRGYKPWATDKSSNGAWWMPLLEKAYAKLDQNYDRIIAGNGMEGLRTLTGMPTIDIRNKKTDIDKLKPIHSHWARKNYPMTTGCCYSGGVYGLVSGHAYSLLDIKDITYHG